MNSDLFKLVLQFFGVSPYFKLIPVFLLWLDLGLDSLDLDSQRADRTVLPISLASENEVKGMGLQSTSAPSEHQPGSPSGGCI